MKFLSEKEVKEIFGEKEIIIKGNAVWVNPLSQIQRRILVYLRKSGSGGYNMMGLARATVADNCRKLVNMGLIKKYHQKLANFGQGRPKTVWRLIE